MLELKDKQKECQLHSRPFEVFCKDQMKPFCVECIIEGGVVPKNMIKFSAISAKAEKLKANVGDINIRKDESRKKFVSLLKEQEKSLKRQLDEEFDKILEPIMKLKKKIRRDIDILVLTQEETYDRENGLLQEMMVWKNDKENMLKRWASTVSPDSDLIQKLVEDPKDKMEEEELNRFVTKFETSKNVFEQETDHVKNTILSVVDGINLPHKTFDQVLEKKVEFSPSLIDKREENHLKECLLEYGFEVHQKQENDMKIIQINQGYQNKSPQKSFLDQYFYCSLEKLNIECKDLTSHHFQTVCSIIEKIADLSELRVSADNSNDAELLSLSQVMKNLNNLNSFDLNYSSDILTEGHFYELWIALSYLNSLKSLNISLTGDLLFDEQVFQDDKPLGLFQKLSCLNLSFHSCEVTPKNQLKYLWESLEKAACLEKLTLFLDTCTQEFNPPFNQFLQVLPKIKTLQDLELSFNNFEGVVDLSELTVLLDSLSELTNLKNFKFCIPFIGSFIPIQDVFQCFKERKNTVPNLESFYLDVSQNYCLDDEILTDLEPFLNLMSLTLLQLTLKLDESKVSEKWLCSFIDSLGKFTKLQALTISCYNCQNIKENNRLVLDETLQKLTTVSEKEIVYTKTSIRSRSNHHSRRPVLPFRAIRPVQRHTDNDSSSSDEELSDS